MYIFVVATEFKRLGFYPPQKKNHKSLCLTIVCVVWANSKGISAVINYILGRIKEMQMQRRRRKSIWSCFNPTACMVGLVFLIVALFYSIRRTKWVLFFHFHYTSFFYDTVIIIHNSKTQRRCRSKRSSKLSQMIEDTIFMAHTVQYIVYSSPNISGWLSLSLVKKTSKIDLGLGKYKNEKNQISMSFF